MAGVTLSILQHILKVQNATKCVSFYESHFGMKVLSKVKDLHGNEHYMLGFKEASGKHVHGDKHNAVLELVGRETAPPAGEVLCPYVLPARQPVRLVNHGGKDGIYWKIAVHMADVDEAIRKLNGRGLELGAASQFRDIGYLKHLADPDSYGIELLQFTFEGKVAPHTAIPEHPLNQQPTFGLITLRISHIDKALKFYRDVLGMKLVCRQDVSVYNFVLFFLAFTDESPPCADLDAIENREWLYQRPYTVLELQVINDGAARQFEPVTDDAYGFMGLGFGCSDIAGLQAHLEKQGVSVCERTDSHELFKCPSLTVHDPHGIPIRFTAHQS